MVKIGRSQSNRSWPKFLPVLFLALLLACCLWAYAEMFQYYSSRIEAGGIGVADPIEDQATPTDVDSVAAESPIKADSTTAKSQGGDVKEAAARDAQAVACDKPGGIRGFLSQGDAKRVVNAYVANQTQRGYKPRFVPVLNELMEESKRQGTTMLTVQLGGMDGKTGDPMYRMTQFHQRLDNWMPVAFEPVPVNFKNLVQTYDGHKAGKGLPCSHLLNQAVNYDKSRETNGGCDFCFYDHDNKKCEEQNHADWFKNEIGSMGCEAQSDPSRKECFIKRRLPCGPIGKALRDLGLLSGDVVAVQMDVEGFEGQVLDGLFNELPPDQYPPVINFESRVLKARHELDTVYEKLRKAGYGIHEKRVETLALLE